MADLPAPSSSQIGGQVSETPKPRQHPHEVETRPRSDDDEEMSNDPAPPKGRAQQPRQPKHVNIDAEGTSDDDGFLDSLSSPSKWGWPVTATTTCLIVYCVLLTVTVNVLAAALGGTRSDRGRIGHHSVFLVETQLPGAGSSKTAQMTQFHTQFCHSATMVAALMIYHINRNNKESVC
jgi:hypothetical protein